jgi:hypothetical protein
MRNTPNFPSRRGAFAAAAKLSPSTCRVWAGSMTPSSHRLDKPMSMSEWWQRWAVHRTGHWQSKDGPRARTAPESCPFLSWPCFPSTGATVSSTEDTVSPQPHLVHYSQHIRSLLAAHHRDACVRPHVQKVGAVTACEMRRLRPLPPGDTPVRPTAHAVVAGTKAPSNEHSNLGHGRCCHGRHKLGAVLGNATSLVGSTDHES